MDRKLPEKAEIEQLILQSAAARTCLGSEMTALRKRLDLPDRLRSSMAAHPSGWVLGSLGSGLVASALFRRRPRVTAPSGRKLLTGFPGLILTLLKPLAKVWLANLLKDLISRQIQPAPATRPNPRSQLL